MEEKNQTKKDTQKVKTNKWGILSFVLVLFALFIIVSLPQLVKFKKTMYCQFTDNESIAPVYRCGIMKVVSKEINEVNFEQLVNVNITSFSCSEDLDSLPKCPANNLYYLYYPLKTFCNEPDCNITGDICFWYSIEYYDQRLEYIQFYEETFMQEKFNSTKELDDKFEECGRSD